MERLLRLEQPQVEAPALALETDNNRTGIGEDSKGMAVRPPTNSNERSLLGRKKGWETSSSTNIRAAEMHPTNFQGRRRKSSAAQVQNTRMVQMWNGHCPVVAC
jgi:hypothetical protein